VENRHVRLEAVCCRLRLSSQRWSCTSSYRGWTLILTAGLEGGVASLQEPTFDLVLVDGRARLACAMYVMRYLTDDSVVVIHDLMPRIMNADAASKLGKVSSRVLNTPEYWQRVFDRKRKQVFVEECGVGMSDKSSVSQLDMLFKYYDLIGHTRTIAAFRRKPGGVRPHDDEWREHIAGFHRHPY
jgi:hypothetical protein